MLKLLPTEEAPVTLIGEVAPVIVEAVEVTGVVPVVAVVLGVVTVEVGVVTVVALGAGAVAAVSVKGTATVFVAVGVVVAPFPAVTRDFVAAFGRVRRVAGAFFFVELAFAPTGSHLRGAGFWWRLRLRVTQDDFRVPLA